MKKVLLMCLIFALTLGTAFTVSANELECDTCKYTLKEIPCSDVQGGCDPQSVDWDKFIFPVCDCDDSAIHFAKGKKIGIQMDILTPGVYWGGAPAGLNVVAYKSSTDACDGKDPLPAASAPVSAEFSSVFYYPNDDCAPSQAYKPGVSYGKLDHKLCTWNDVYNYPKYQTLRTDTLTPNAFFTIPDNNIYDANGNVTGQDPAIDDWNGYTYWTVQIPPIKIDTTEVLAAKLRGEPIQIRIQMLSAGSGGICTKCNVLCECIIDVAIICDQEKGCAVFPYVVTQLSPWATGIAISNMGDLPAEEMEATFYLTDKDGKTFSYTKKDFTTIHWANVMDNILGEFDGTPAAGASVLRVETNFYLDGYQFITDGVFGGSTNSRTWWDACPEAKTGWNQGK